MEVESLAHGEAVGVPDASAHDFLDDFGLDFESVFGEKTGSKSRNALRLPMGSRFGAASGIAIGVTLWIRGKSYVENPVVCPDAPQPPGSTLSQSGS